MSTKRETAVKILEAGVGAANKLVEEAANEILVVSAIGILCGLGAAVLKKGGEKKKES